MKVVVLALAGSCLALAVVACGGGGARSAGPAPSVPVETGPPATSRGNTTEEQAGSGYGRTLQYAARADAICKAASDKLEAAVRKLDTTQPGDRQALDELAFRLSGNALAELRALPPPGGPAVNPVALCSHRGGTQGSVSPVTRAEFIAQATAICDAAFARLGFTDLTEPKQALKAARVEEEALAELRALPQPEADRALLEEAFYAVVEQDIEVLRAAAAASSAGDIARDYLLGEERVHLTHQRDQFATGYGLGGDGCPVPLPA
jgi:hypothetical protein